jgi:CRP/FNR family cyclic AMP-dependent transcriptional regulator
MPTLEAIQQSRVFQGLNNQQLQTIASIAREEAYATGQAIFKEGEPALNFYILEEGKVILEMRPAPVREHSPSPLVIIDVIVKGETFGWSALVQPHIFTLSASTADKSKVVTIGGGKLRELMDADPVMGYQVMTGLSQVIASRLGHTRQILLSERGLALLSEIYSY